VNEFNWPNTLCDGLRGALGVPHFAPLKSHARVIMADDAAIIAAQRLLWQVLKQVIGPLLAIGSVAFLAQKQRFIWLNVGMILSTGNVDVDALAWRQR